MPPEILCHRMSHNKQVGLHFPSSAFRGAPADTLSTGFIFFHFFSTRPDLPLFPSCISFPSTYSPSFNSFSPSPFPFSHFIFPSIISFTASYSPSFMPISPSLFPLSHLLLTLPSSLPSFSLVSPFPLLSLPSIPSHPLSLSLPSPPHPCITTILEHRELGLALASSLRVEETFAKRLRSPPGAPRSLKLPVKTRACENVCHSVVSLVPCFLMKYVAFQAIALAPTPGTAAHHYECNPCTSQAPPLLLLLRRATPNGTKRRPPLSRRHPRGNLSTDQNTHTGRHR